MHGQISHANKTTPISKQEETIRSQKIWIVSLCSRSTDFPWSKLYHHVPQQHFIQKKLILVSNVHFINKLSKISFFQIIDSILLWSCLTARVPIVHQKVGSPQKLWMNPKHRKYKLSKVRKDLTLEYDGSSKVNHLCIL